MTPTKVITLEAYYVLPKTPFLNTVGVEEIVTTYEIVDDDTDEVHTIVKPSSKERMKNGYGL
jgi:hypothetical protein